MSRPALLACCVALLWLALLNGYPLLYYDTGTYLRAAVERFAAPVDRPVVYGWFIYLASLNLSPWLVVLAQAAIAVWVMGLAIRIVDPGMGGAGAAACVAAAALLTSAPFFVGQLMPDYFAGVLPLALFAMVAGDERVTAAQRAGLFALIAFGVGSHASHAAVAVAAIGALWAWRALPRNAATVPARHRGALAALAAVVVACLVVASNNLATYGRFVLAPAAHAFLVGRLVEDGPAARHLRRACPAAGYRLCAFVDRLPWTADEYLWGGILSGSGDWLGSREESWTIIRRTVDAEPGAVAANALAAAARQCLANGTGDVALPIPEGHGARLRLALQHPGDVEEFERSLQQASVLHSAAFRAWSQVLRAIFGVLALAACVLAWRGRAARARGLDLVVGCVAFYAANALVLGALSGVHERYQSRVSWPLAFAGIVLVAGAVRERRAARAG